MTFDELLARARQDLADIDDNLRWAFFDGYQPSNADPARIAGTNTQDVFGRDTESNIESRNSTPDVAPDDPDTVRAPRHDVGVGDHRSRTTYRKTTGRLHQAEHELAHALAITRVAQPELIEPNETTTLPDVLRCVRYLRIRLDLATNTSLEGQARRQARKAASHIASAWHHLNRNFERGEITPTDAFATRDLCRICKIRPRADKKGGRCNTCYQWFHRNNFERPTKLDSVGDARDAQSRRRARGEGWGDESFSGATG